MIQKILILFIFLGITLFSEADMKIKITCGVNTAQPIAIIPFSYIHQHDIGGNTENIGSIISDDLRNSGRFNTLPVSYLPYQPSKVSDIIPEFWEKLGINMVVLGSINLHNNNYIISYQLIDTSSNPALVILENQFSSKNKWLRYIAHTISNEIFEKLTGIKGIFCTNIVYVSHSNNNKYSYKLYIADYDGHNPVLIYQSTEPLMSPAWSPDGKKIAYVTFSSGKSELVVRTLSTGLIDNVINFPNHNGAPAFSPDGKKLAFSLSQTGSLNLYIMDLFSEKISQLTANRYNNTEPSWFPDSQNLAYTSDQGGIPQVYKININTSNVQRLSWLSTSNQSPSVSIDGTFVVMVNRNQGEQKISKLDLLTGAEQILTVDTVFADTPSISPNGTMLLYSTIKGSKSILQLTSIDGLFKACLQESDENIRFPAWSLLPCS